jgi:hypothetical protein
MSAFLDRPAEAEYAPFYAGYIHLVPPGDVRDHLRTQLHETITLLSGVSEERAGQAYAPGKWTVKEVVGHMTDAERVFSYRMVSIARGDPASLPSFDENLWAPHSNANARTMASLLLEFASVRASTAQLAGSLTEEAFTRRGTASGNLISVRALAYVCAGHERHHLKVIRERYLGL